MQVSGQRRQGAGAGFAAEDAGRAIVRH
jgi:hypothetical protein